MLWKKTALLYSLLIPSRASKKSSRIDLSWIHRRKYRHLTVSKFIGCCGVFSYKNMSWPSFTKSQEIKTCFLFMNRTLLFIFVARPKEIPSFRILVTLSISYTALPFKKIKMLSFSLAPCFLLWFCRKYKGMLWGLSCLSRPAGWRTCSAPLFCTLHCCSLALWPDRWLNQTKKNNFWVLQNWKKSNQKIYQMTN